MRRVRHFTGYSRPRLYLVVGFFGLSFLAILVRLTVVQVGQYAYWRDSAEAQYGRRITVSPVRGRIFDRRNNVLAASIPAPSVFAAPPEIRQPGATAQKLANIFPPFPKAALSSNSPPRLPLSGWHVKCHRKRHQHWKPWSSPVSTSRKKRVGFILEALWRAPR